MTVYCITVGKKDNPSVGDFFPQPPCVYEDVLDAADAAIACMDELGGNFIRATPKCQHVIRQWENDRDVVWLEELSVESKP